MLYPAQSFSTHPIAAAGRMHARYLLAQKGVLLNWIGTVGVLPNDLLGF
ncbi:MAG: hypothetical protein IGQ88_03325 [Gloeomargaritaceae cyanobacterium C42_A2020_066]|nr:hypothetical protein [Gloeomargaritaceae cyanobacterium C42_A2020_066]